jgi:type IV pilus assembly protein PilC
VVGLVERGEQTQKLRAALANVADYLEHRNQMQSALRGAVAQPINALSLVLLAVFVATVVLSFLVKETLPVVETGQHVLTSFTDRVAVAVSEAVRVAWPFVGVFGLLCFVALRLIPKQPTTRAWLDRLALRLPLIGPAVHSVGLAIFYRTIGVCMQAGGHLAQAMQIAAITAPSYGIRDRIVAIIAAINSNRPYIETLVDHGFMRLGDVTAVQAGERRGDLGAVMLALAGDREREAAVESSRLKALAHTVVVILLAVTILGVVFTLYVPVFVLR